MTFASVLSRDGMDRPVDAGEYVTHLCDLAHSIEAETDDRALFLRAERLPDGSRSFKLVEAGPLDTSFGVDLYREILDVSVSDAEPAGCR